MAATLFKWAKFIEIFLFDMGPFSAIIWAIMLALCITGYLSYKNNWGNWALNIFFILSAILTIGVWVFAYLWAITA